MIIHRMTQSAPSKQLNEKRSTVGAIVRQWKKHKINDDTSKISADGTNDHEESSQDYGEEVVIDLKRAGITGTKVTIVTHRFKSSRAPTVRAK